MCHPMVVLDGIILITSMNPKYEPGENSNIHCTKINLKTEAALSDHRMKGVITG
jgi:hypothetical protein